MHSSILFQTIFFKRVIASLILICAFASMVKAQQNTSQPIRFRQKTIYPSQTAFQWMDSASRTGQLKSPVQVILKLNDAQVNKDELARQGIYIREYVSANTWTAIIQPRKDRSAASINGVSYIIPVVPQWKIGAIPSAIKNNKTQHWMVSCFPDADEAAFKQELAAVGGQLLYSPMADKRFYEIVLSTDKIQTLAAWYGIRSIGISGEDQPLNFESATATTANIAHLPSLSGGYGLMGDSITIGVGDNTSGMNNIDLRDRIINYNPAPYTNHGIHVTGTVAASGTMDRKGEGFAPHATIINNMGRFIWLNAGTMKQQHNMNLTNNSYTIVAGFCDNAGVYDVNSQILDTLAFIYPEMLHVFAAGNDGSITCSPFTNGFSTITGNYQPAKNVLTVAQCDKFFNWGVNSSKGPVLDGRLKPEITAVGTGVISTRSGDIYLTSGGTSMASPQITGGAALLQQQYKRMNGNVYPPSDLVKALLMNGATDIGNPGPDFTFGFGVMNMNRSLDMLKNNRYVRNSLANFNQNTFSLNVPVNTAQIKVMLYWHDPPASAFSVSQLVNNLDLELVDASNNVIRPLVLNPAPASVNSTAQPGVDLINNVEQVVINPPFNGPYTVRVKAMDVVYGPQTYNVVYDFIPTGVRLNYPTTGASIASGGALKIYWDAAADTSKFMLEFSDNNGSSWTTIDAAIPAAQRYYVWTPPTNISSAQCLMRLTRSAEVFTTGNFVTNIEPSVILDNAQCPGYINIHWTPVANATAYQILRKKGPFLQPETTVTDTFYSFKGLSPDSLYYVAMVPLINNVPGYRTQSIKRKPNNGSCTGSFSDGDLRAEQLESPVSGRMFTSSQLGNNVTLNVRVYNLDDIAANNYRISYSMNGSPWQSQVFTTSIPASSSLVIPVPTTLNMSTSGNYDLRIAVTNLALTDNVPQNDTLKRSVRNLENNLVNIYTGYMDGFESTAALTSAQDTLGFTPDQHWDYANSNDTGILRTLMNSDITISGNRSLSLSTLQFTATPVTNTITGTFNTAVYTVSNDELRLEFDYKMHGQSHFADSNKVWVRAADSLAWFPIYSYNLNANTGSIIHSGSLSITDAVIAQGKNYTTSMQVRFGQQDTTVISLNNYGAGVTLDNVKLYAVQNDIALDSILSPGNFACELNNSPVSVRVYNGVMPTQHNIQVAYCIDNGPVYTGMIDSLSGKSSTIYTFSQLINSITPGLHTLKTWASVAGDTYTKNDTFTLTVRNEPLIASYPYLENFETNDGYWYTDGSNSSWQYGTPTSLHVPQAASGTKAWKTNLTGTYNDDELSYLYSPCYDISGLTQPMLSFSTVFEIENCGNPICDGAWVEYSLDNGQNWTKLGTAGQGQNWYTNATANVWDLEGNYRWRVASIPLPVTSQTLRLRFVLTSDPGVTKEGISLDDVHIYNRDYPLYNSTTVGPISQSVSGNNYSTFLSGGKIFAQIKPDGQNIGNTDVSIYVQPSVPNTGQQYFLPENFTVQTANQPADSVTARFYVTDAAVQLLISANNCGACTKPKDVYRLGIAKYDDAVQSNENGSLTDNIGGTWTYYSYNKVKWVPYDIGYFAEVRVPSFSEIWFGDGNGLTPLPLKLLSFGLQKGTDNALLNWELQQTEGGELIALQRSSDGLNYKDIHATTVPAQQSVKQSYNDTNPVKGINYYRLVITEKNGSIGYSKTLSAMFMDTEDVFSIYPNPAKHTVQLEWTNKNEPATIKIQNLTGQILFSKTLTDNHISIPLSSFISGLYIVSFRQGNIYKTSKLSIEK